MDDVVATKLLWRAFRAELQEERARSPEVTAWVLVGNLRWLALKQPAHFFACTAPICRGRNLTVEPRRYTHPVKPQGRQERFTFLSFWSVKSCITCIPFLLLDVWLPVSELLPMANAPWQLPFTSNHCNLHHNTRTLIESNSADSASAQKWIRRSIRAPILRQAFVAPDHRKQQAGLNLSTSILRLAKLSGTPIRIFFPPIQLAAAASSVKVLLCEIQEEGNVLGGSPRLYWILLRQKRN